MDGDEDCYQLLQCPPDASAQQIRLKYKELALRLHPDKRESEERDGSEFAAVSKAYATLSDPLHRNRHDAVRTRRKVEDGAVHDEVGIGDFVYTSDSDVYQMECRCGCYFSLLGSDFRDKGGGRDRETVVCECESCSQAVLVRIKEEK